MRACRRSAENPFLRRGSAPTRHGMTDLRFRRAAIRILLSVLVAAAALAVLVPRQVAEPENALQSAVAGALAARADDRLLKGSWRSIPKARRQS